MLDQDIYQNAIIDLDAAGLYVPVANLEIDPKVQAGKVVGGQLVYIDIDRLENESLEAGMTRVLELCYPSRAAAWRNGEVKPTEPEVVPIPVGSVEVKKEVPAFDPTVRSGLAAEVAPVVAPVSTELDPEIAAIWIGAKDYLKRRVGGSVGAQKQALEQYFKDVLGGRPFSAEGVAMFTLTEVKTCHEWARRYKPEGKDRTSVISRASTAHKTDQEIADLMFSIQDEIGDDEYALQFVPELIQLGYLGDDGMMVAGVSDETRLKALEAMKRRNNNRKIAAGEPLLEAA